MSSDGSFTTVVYTLESGTDAGLTKITVSGIVQQTPLSVVASQGSATVGKILNPRVATRNVVWNGLSLGSGEAATLTITFARASSGTPLTGAWSANATQNHQTLKLTAIQVLEP